MLYQEKFTENQLTGHWKQRMVETGSKSKNSFGRQYCTNHFCELYQTYVAKKRAAMFTKSQEVIPSPPMFSPGYLSWSSRHISRVRLPVKAV